MMNNDSKIRSGARAIGSYLFDPYFVQKSLLKQFKAGKLKDRKTGKKLTKAQFKYELSGITNEKWIKANVK